MKSGNVSSLPRDRRSKGEQRQIETATLLPSDLLIWLGSPTLARMPSCGLRWISKPPCSQFSSPFSTMRADAQRASLQSSIHAD